MSAGKLLYLKEKSDDGLRNGCKHKGDDDASGGGGGGDPAVLAMGPARSPLVYTREQLMRLRDSPLVKQGLENAFVGCDALALVLKKRPDSPHDDDRGAKGDGSNDNHKGVYGGSRSERRSADPRERVRKEGSPSGGIVLSPQRRSFTSGCGAPATAPAPPHVARTRPESPLSKTEARRVGSGRLMMRDVTAVPWEREEGDNFRGTNREREERTIPRNSDSRDIERDNFRGTNREREERSIPRNNDREIERDNFRGTNREREERSIPRNNDREIERDNFRATIREREERSIPRNTDSRYERRSFTRDSFGSDVKRERDDRFSNEKNNRDDNRRSSGRYNQRRYDKDEEPEWFSAGPTSQLDTIELRGFDDPPKRNGTVNSSKQNTEKWSGGSKSPTLEKWRASPQRSPPPASPGPAEPTQNETEEKPPENPSQNCADQEDFNLDDFLKSDSVPDILTNGGSEESGGSRFSRWFQRSETPTQDYERYINNLVDGDDLDNPPSANMFTPIAPAEPSLLELLRRANNDDTPDHLNTSGGGKMHNLQELEAGFRPPPSLSQDHDMTAFKRLLAQVSGGHVVPAEPRPPPPPQPMSLLQMLSKSMEQKPPQPQPPHIPQDLLYKLLHVQRQQEQQLGNNGPAMHSQPPPPPMQPQDRELLQRPEAVALIQGLKSGEITPAHVVQQLNNPALQSRHRELLQAVLRTQQHHQMGGSPLPYAHMAPPHLTVPHHQQLRLSPLPHSTFCVSPIMAASPNALTMHHPGVPPRIPSPRELVAHTQSIMQGALIKRKLEEQKENFRRRHEHSKQAPHMAFTPTSVLRKMTAEKEAEPLSPKHHQWNQPQKMPQGRPIVKGNQSGMSAGMPYPSHPPDYHYLQQQQMASGRQFPHPQQRQPPVMNNINNMNNVNMGRGPPITSSLQQLIQQSHQRTMNEMGIGSAGGDNQLSRWFSPELLAQASAGKLPSVHVPNALALEDLERSHHSPAVRN